MLLSPLDFPASAVALAPNVESGVARLEVPQPPATPLTLSVVMAVYNEAATVAEPDRRVLRSPFRRSTIELVIVESNSTDGSREVVSRYADDPGCDLVLQDAARAARATRCARASSTRRAASS